MKRASIAALALLMPWPALAHHGKDFLNVESYEVPHPGDVYGLAAGAWATEDDVEESALEPGLLFGLFPRAAGEVHAHFAKAEDESFEYEAISPAIHVQVTDPQGANLLQVGFSAEYEFAAQVDPDRFEGRLILERAFDAFKLSLNGIAEHVGGADTEYGYAAALRFDASDTVGVGAETHGSFETHAGEGLVGVYLEPNERFTVKFGAGTRLGSFGPDLSGRIGLVYRF